jgi:hypothetical protein
MIGRGHPKFVLWAGPEDGLEVQIPAGQQTYFIPGPARIPNHPGEISENGEPPMWKGCYEYNMKTEKFEWKGYE